MNQHSPSPYAWYFRALKGVDQEIHENEMWRAINREFVGSFEVSDQGRVRHARTKRVRSSNDRGGYKRTRIEGKFYSVHRLVAEAFIPNHKKYPCINHIDGVKSNNFVHNLEWCDHAMNARHAVKLGLMVGFRGSLNGSAKLNEKQVAQIKRWTPLAIRQVDLADAFGVSQRAISLIVRGEKWSHV